MSESIGNEMYTLRINGQDRPVKDAWVGESLLYVLRERLELPGAKGCLLYTSPSPRDRQKSRMPSSA